MVRRLTLALTVGMCTVFAVYAILSVQRQAAYFRQEAVRDQQTIGRALAMSVATVWSVYGDAAAEDLVARMNGREPNTTIRWIDLGKPATLPSAASSAIAPLAAEVRTALLAGEHFTSVKRKASSTVGMIQTYVPVRSEDMVVGAIMLEDTLAAERAFLYARVRRMVVAGTLMILVASLLAMALGMQIVARPMRRLMAKARRIGAGDFGDPLPTSQRDELGELAAEMNAMAAQLTDAHRRLREETGVRIAALEQLRHAERLSTVGRLASGVAHELGTPLNVISGRAQMIAAGEVAGSEVAACAKIIDAQASRMATIIRQLLNLARRPAPRRATVDLEDLVDDTLTLLTPLAEKRGVTFVRAAADAVDVDGHGALNGHRAHATAADDGSSGRDGVAPVDAEQVRQVVTNLVMNAIQASPKGARVDVTVDRVAAERPRSETPGEFVRISVVDHGRGIAGDVLPHIFEPFYTTKDVGDGTGLGLSVAYGIVEDHAGWIDVRSTPEAGTRFDVYFPAQAVT